VGKGLVGLAHPVYFLPLLHRATPAFGGRDPASDFLYEADLA